MRVLTEQELMAVVVRVSPGLFDARQRDSVHELDAVREPLEKWLAAPGLAAEAAAAAAAPLWRWWVVTGRIDAGLRTLTALREGLPVRGRAWRALTASMAALHYFAGHDVELAAVADAGLEGDDGAEPGVTGLLLLARGWALQAAGAPDPAIDVVRLAEQRFAEAGYPWGHAVALLTLGEIRREHGDVPQARQAYERSLELYRALGDPSAVSACLTNLGLLLRMDGDVRAARNYLSEAATTSERVGNQLFLATDLLGLAAVALDEHDREQARDYLNRSEGIITRLGAEPEPADRPLLAELRGALRA